MLPTAVFRADASPLIGGGHVVRCLSLAQALMDAKVRCLFAVSPETLTQVPNLTASGCEVHVLDDPSQPAALAGLDCPGAPVVIDHYGLGIAYETAIRSAGHPVVAVEDIPGRSHDCDVLLDITYGRRAGEYTGLVSATTRLLLGADYICLGAEFARLREGALIRRQRAEPVRRMLVAFGFADQGITAWAVNAIRDIVRDLDLDVAFGPGATSEAAIQSDIAAGARMQLHVATPHMARLMVDADIAIGGFGSTNWERCCLGLPSVGLQLADNQAHIARAMRRLGAALAIDDPSDAPRLRAAVQQLRDDAGLRSRMAETAGAVCDGGGAARVARAILDLV